MKKKKSKSSGSNFGKKYFKDFLVELSRLVAYLLVIMIVLYFVTGYAMTSENQIFEYIHLNKEMAFYIHQQLAVPFVACVLIHILPSLTK